MGTFDYDAAGRLERHSYTDFFGSTVFGERTAWTPRGLKAAQSRTDLNDKSLHFGYDGAGRVVDAEHAIDLNVPLPIGSVGGVPGQWAFTYDAVQNLASKSSELVCEGSAVQLPLDGSGRNRPGQVGDVPLSWDANGNLASKDELTFLYDYRDRLTEVRSGATVVAAYTYDAFNRRIERTAGGVTEETVWSAWQPIETYRNGQLRSRRTYGLGLDEVVAFEHDLDGDGVLDDEYLPFYDSTGNLALITNTAGKPIERYSYSPYGEQWIQVDSTPPSIEQVRIKDGKILVEMSEEIRLEELEKAITAGTLYVNNLTQAETVELRVTQPVVSGRQARRRFVLDLKPGGGAFWPVADEQFALAVPSTALKDLFGNVATAGFPAETRTWPAADEVLQDTVGPRLEEVCVESGGILRLQFSEELALASVAAEVSVDGQPITWVAGGDGYTLRSEAGLETGIHTLSVAIGPLDLAGLGLPLAFAETLDIDETDPEQMVFSAPYPGLTESSTVANVYGFHGLPRDPETGWIYARNRYYDPEMGRFVTTDPMGYADGPSMYQYALNNPANFSDPTGEIALADNLVGGAVSVGVGYLVTCVVGECSDYSRSDAAIDFGLGFATSGLSSVGQLRHLRHGARGVARFAARAGAEVGLDAGTEYLRQTIRNPGEDISLRGLAQGAVLNSVIGGAGSLAAKRFARFRSSLRGSRVAEFSGVREAGSGLRVKTGLRAGSAGGGGGSFVPSGTGPAHSAANAERLRIQLTAEEIAHGHAFEKHVLQQGEFRGLDIRTRTQFQQHVEDVLSSPTAVRYYRDGRRAYLHEPTGTVLIRNPLSGESTAFQPANWTEYLTTRLPTRTTPYP